MSSCTWGCHEVEASVEKLQSLLAMESHLDEEMDELERLYQLDQLKCEWLMREGRSDLCDVIKEQMQKTESLLRLYSPMLQNTCAEKEAHITHILAMQRQRRLMAARGRHLQHRQLQHQQLQHQGLRRQTPGMIPEPHLAQNDLFQCHSILNGYQTQSHDLQYFSTNPRPSTKDPESVKRKEDRLPSCIVEGQEKSENMLGFQELNYRRMKRRLLKILHRSKEWRNKKLLRCKVSSIQKQNSSNVSLPNLKAKGVCKKTMWKFGQFRHHHSLFSKGMQRKPLTGIGKKIYERCSSGQVLHVSAKRRQLVEVSLGNYKMSKTKRTTNSMGKRLMCCNHARRTKLGNKSKYLHGNLLSIPETHHKEKLPKQDHSRFLCTTPYDPLHKNRQCRSFKFKKSIHHSHDQGTLTSNGTGNPNRGSRNNSPRLNSTASGSLVEAERLTVSVITDVAGEEQSSLQINNYVLPLLNGVDLLEADYVRD